MKRPLLSAALQAILAETLNDESASSHLYKIRLARRADGLTRVARSELRRVYAREFAYLLREAARLRSVLDPKARAWRWLADKPSTLSAWRHAFNDALASFARDAGQAAPDLAWIFERCRSNDIADWPTPLELAEASVALASDEAGRLERVVALLALGQARAAAHQAAAELDPELQPRRRAEFLAALAGARELELRFDDAAGFYDLALTHAERTECAMHSAAHLLYLSLALGAREPATRAADALVRHAARGDFDAREFERCTGALCAVTARLRGGRQFGVHPSMARQYLRFTVASPAVVRHVAVALS